MQQGLSFSKVPDEIAFTDVLLEFEKPQIVIPGKNLKLPQSENSGDAFHDKKAKNKKVYVR
jgi:ATP-dependent RNA helicase RhlE